LKQVCLCHSRVFVPDAYWQIFREGCTRSHVRSGGSTPAHFLRTGATFD
jgi:hypothetical protein